jgi:hypothetical protein
MKTESVEHLTLELEALRIRVAQLEAAAAATEQGDDRNRNRGAEAAGTRKHQEVTATNEFKEGDRVRIKNQLKRPATWSGKDSWDKKQAQKATVTHTYKEQVHFVTDNGVKTWRAVNNLELIK